MKKDFREAITHRRSYYDINNQSPIGDEEIKDILEAAIKDVPSAFNSQSARYVLLLHEQHKKLWDIVKNTLQKIVPPENFKATENKINNSFASGYGTVLFFEDQEIIENLQKAFPLYADNFPIWSLESSGMNQFAVWTMLEDAGFGASLQHYNPLIDDAVKKEWNLNPKWNLIAQMPFGTPTAEPETKKFNPLSERLYIFD